MTLVRAGDGGDGLSAGVSPGSAVEAGAPWLLPSAGSDEAELHATRSAQKDDRATANVERRILSSGGGLAHERTAGKQARMSRRIRNRGLHSFVVRLGGLCDAIDPWLSLGGHFARWMRRP